MEFISTPNLHLYSLPNEVLIQILSPFTTRELLHLATVSQRFHALVLRLLHYRLLFSASLTEYKLVLDCFHPASRLTEPHVFCKYLGTPGLSHNFEGEGSLYENVDTARQLARLGSVYSIFKLSQTEEGYTTGVTPVAHSVRRYVTIEEFENFSQLCVVMKVVKLRGLPGTTALLSAVDVEDGVVRLFRSWLKSQADRPQHSQHHDGDQDPAILWVDQNKNVGIKFRVREVTRPVSDFPVFDEESSSSYEISIDELHIRTTRLILTVEQIREQESNSPVSLIYLHGPFFTAQTCYYQEERVKRAIRK
ncbi:hypothetical protein BJX76DRAFT_348861 [Aspergillus varians]